MRDPNRIDEFCNELAQLWHQVPDWRFGQLIYNLILTKLTSGGIFYTEDEDMINIIKEKMKELDLLWE